MAFLESYAHITLLLKQKCNMDYMELIYSGKNNCHMQWDLKKKKTGLGLGHLDAGLHR
jgi:hypothetical protein